MKRAKPAGAKNRKAGTAPKTGLPEGAVEVEGAPRITLALDKSDSITGLYTGTTVHKSSFGKNTKHNFVIGDDVSVALWGCADLNFKLDDPAMIGKVLFVRFEGDTKDGDMVMHAYTVAVCRSDTKRTDPKSLPQ